MTCNDNMALENWYYHVLAEEGSAGNVGKSGERAQSVPARHKEEVVVDGSIAYC